MAPAVGRRPTYLHIIPAQKVQERRQWMAANLEKAGIELPLSANLDLWIARAAAHEARLTADSACIDVLSCAWGSAPRDRFEAGAILVRLEVATKDDLVDLKSILGTDGTEPGVIEPVVALA